jgi:hypothetical protein
MLLTESWISLAVATAILGASLTPTVKVRRGISLAALVVLLVAMLRLPLTLDVPEGDYRNFVEDRDHFRDYMVNQVNFQYHLSSQVVRGFDELFGASVSSMTKAFDALIRLGALIFVGGMIGLGYVEHWSERVVRYIGLAAAVPTVVLLYGYSEFGHLPIALQATAIPLALIALEHRRWRLLTVAGGLLGVATALHGFGIIGFAFTFVMAGVYIVREQDIPNRHGLARLANAAVYGLAGWLVWVPLYPILLNKDIAAGHADELPLRALFDDKPYPEYHRIAEPVFSSQGLTEIGYEFWIVGVLALALLALVPSRLRLPVLVASIPVLLFLTFFWPVQGLASDTDFLASSFPPVLAVAWLVAPSRRASAVALAILVVGHWALDHVLTPDFVDDGGEI